MTGGAPDRDGFRPAVAWTGLGAAFLGLLSIGFSFHFVSPILPAMIADLGIGHGAAGLLMSLFALPGIVLSFPAGWLTDRWGPDRTGGLGLLVMGLGTLAVGAGPTFGVILAGRTLTGVGVSLAVVALQRMIAALFAGRNLGLPMGVSGMAVPLGIILILNLAGPWSERAGWRQVALGTGTFAVLASLVFFGVARLLPGSGREGTRPPGGSSSSGPQPAGHLSFRPIWLAGWVWFFANGAMTAFMTFAPNHFFELGWGVQARGLVTSIPMWGSVLLGPLIGWLSDRQGGKPAFMGLGMILMSLALLAVPGGRIPQPVIGIALGGALAAVVTPLLSLPGTLLATHQVGRGYGILATCANVGIFCLPPAAGLVRDATGGFTGPFLLLGGAAAAGVLGAEALRRSRVVPGWTWPRRPHH